MKKLLTEADGRALAIRMLRDLERQSWRVNERVCKSLGENDDAPDMRDVLLNEEPEIFRRYLATVRAERNAKVERGFLCVLSEFMGSAAVESGFDRYEDYLEPRSPPRPFASA